MQFIATIRQQIIYISILVVTFGLISTDAYYMTFGLRYQEIGLPYDHLVYRGFLLPFRQPYFLLLYMIIIVSTAYASADFTVKLWKIRFNRTVVFYVMVGLCFVVGIKMARKTGTDLAIADVYSNTTSLRQLTMFQGTDTKKNAFVNGMLGEGKILIVRRTANSLVLVREPSFPSERPRLAMFHVGVGSDDFYSDSIPMFR